MTSTMSVFKLNRKALVILALIVTTIMYYAFSSSNDFVSRQYKPTSLTSQDNVLAELVNKIRRSNDPTIKTAAETQLFSLLSEIVQNQIHHLQKKTNCSGVNIVCGHNDECGLGCQIHHRAACLMVSYASRVPLIHDESSWPYNDKWSSAFLPLGSDCKKGPQTFRLVWYWNSNPFPKLLIMTTMITVECCNPYLSVVGPAGEIEYPLKYGIPVPKDIADLVEIIHPSPFMWWIGQFMKFTLRLNESTKKKIQDAKVELQFQNPIVGFHVRRTDKQSEGINTFHPIEEYISIAEKYFQTRFGISNNYTKNIFIASDDATVVNTTLEMNTTKDWNIIGFQSRQTLATQDERRGGLFEMLIDLFLLLESDFVVCGHSSNICRLVLEVFNYMYIDGGNRIKSLDGHYFYQVLGGSIKQEIIKTNSLNVLQNAI